MLIQAINMDADSASRYVDKLDDLFDEMNTIPYGMHPPLARWQCQLDELFEGLCTTNEGSEEVRRSKILLKNLEDADWRKLDICTSEGMARRDQISEGDSSNGSMPYILYASKDNVDNMVTPNGSELSASLGFMNPVSHFHSNKPHLPICVFHLFIPCY